MKCAIMQPAFLPWIGWFDLADQSDVMIILDNVAFSKQSWQQRNRIRTRNNLEFLTVPVITAGLLGQKIQDCRLAEQLFVKKMIKSIQANYAKAPFYSNNIDELVTVMEAAAKTGYLVELNCMLISWMAGKLGVTTPLIRASSLVYRGGERGENVAAICECVCADFYISPAGAEQYLLEDKESFDRRGISVRIQVFEHPEYIQCFLPFIPYASALDLIFNLGPAALHVLRSGRRAARAIGEVA